jgi:hypothetical protein
MDVEMALNRLFTDEELEMVIKDIGLQRADDIDEAIEDLFENVQDIQKLQSELDNAYAKIQYLESIEDDREKLRKQIQQLETLLS